ncbi:hypothetical protein [Embleya sp. NBC_00896]|uniref:hypothetical protein n=1 Tax=Embleya sp. NBC_00896 TaxID=2975961 RepID=UPI002F909B78|nr:hypothetical protein OG928_34495 [Embleya sp. NBC_00896]
MTNPKDVLFTGSVVDRLLDVAVAAHLPTTPPLEDELQRFARVMVDSQTVMWMNPLDATAALLDLLAEETDTPVFATRPAAYRDKLARAARDEPIGDFLHGLAALVRELTRVVPPGFDELPMSQWEAGITFSQTCGLTEYMRSGEFDDVRAAAREIAGMDHPDCQWRIAGLGGELQRLLFMFPRPEAMDAAFAAVHGPTHADVELLLHAVRTHFAEEH